MMPGQIPDPSLAAGSLPSLGPLAGISATTLTDQLKLADFHQLGTMLSPLHFLGRLGKRPLAIKTEVRKYVTQTRWMGEMELRTAYTEHRGGEEICDAGSDCPYVIICRWTKMKKEGNEDERKTK